MYWEICFRNFKWLYDLCHKIKVAQNVKNWGGFFFRSFWLFWDPKMAICDHFWNFLAIFAHFWPFLVSVFSVHIPRIILTIWGPKKLQFYAILGHFFFNFGQRICCWYFCNSGMGWLQHSAPISLVLVCNFMRVDITLLTWLTPKQKRTTERWLWLKTQLT